MAEDGHDSIGRLHGRVALVTGAGRGIGAAIAARLGAMGANVVVCDLDNEPASSTANQIAQAGGQAVAATADVSSPTDVERLVQVARDAGGLDVLVNNAGITRDAMVHKMSDADWDAVLDVNLRGCFNLCRAFYPLLRGSRDSTPAHHRKVINISSINGIYGGAANVNYSAAKAGVIGLTRALAREWARHRINVNAIAPGYIAGTRLTAVREQGEQVGIAADVLERIEHSIPIGRGGRPEDIAGVAAFLASPDSDYVTGQVIEAHGGLEIIPVFA